MRCRPVLATPTLPHHQAQEVRIIQTMARACKLSDEQLAAEISSATAGECRVQLHTDCDGRCMYVCLYIHICVGMYTVHILTYVCTYVHMCRYMCT